ncbi:TrmH family RNA methyltransferase [Capnocytophaga sp. ARDL2]|uniref:TrmH family RNA methyltransferase n=1 Tax=Capnocytophaga sp. ARDL2 TaxID=3238809 RepID=UPI003558E936
MKKIESLKNPLIKELIQLHEKSRKRKQLKRFIIEGKREVFLAQKGNYQIEKIFICEEYHSEGEITKFSQIAKELILISKEIYQKLAYRDTTEGIIALVEEKSHQLNDLKLPENSLVLVVEAIEKPGNLGAILRTADATNIDAVLIANPTTDLYNPNVIRSSVGCVFTNKIAIATTDEVIAYLKKNNISIYSAILQEAVPYYTQDYTSSSAIVVGTEATGLTQVWREHSHKNIIIPMEGEIDSMNVSVAAAVLLFEAKRQRRE